MSKIEKCATKFNMFNLNLSREILDHTSMLSLSVVGSRRQTLSIQLE